MGDLAAASEIFRSMADVVKLDVMVEKRTFYIGCGLVCAGIYFFYKKLNKQLNRIEGQLSLIVHNEETLTAAATLARGLPVNFPQIGVPAILSLIATPTPVLAVAPQGAGNDATQLNG